MSENSKTNLPDDSQSALNMLKKSRLLSTLPSDFLQNLTPFFKVKRYPPQAEVKKEKSNSAEIFFLIRGKIAVYSNGNLIYKLRRLGDMFGDMSFITDKQCSTKEIAATPVELISLNVSEIVEHEKNKSNDLKWALYQLFTAMLVDKLTMCCSTATEQSIVANKLVRLKDLLSETRLKLKASEKIKQDFLSNISHEIRTPMHGVLGMTSLLLNTELSDQQKEFAQIIQRSATDFLAVINNILDFTEIGSGELELQNQPFNIKKTVEKVVKELQPENNHSNLSIITSISQNAPGLVKGDSVRIHQVLINLCGNAIKFTEAGEIQLMVEVISQHNNLIRLKFSVKDTGIGISDEDRNLLFRSFSQVDTSLTRKYDGTGLGLVISRQLVEAMGGEIDFESEKGKGSTFWFILDFEVQEDRRKQIEAHLPHHRNPTRQSDKVRLLHFQEKKKCRILLISNDKIDQFIVQLMLEKLGYSTCILNTVDKASRYLKTNEINVILLDINIPEMTVNKNVRDICFTAHGVSERKIPVIALTSDILNNNTSKWLMNDIYDYLVKPISIENLDMVLQRWISIREEDSICPQLPQKELYNQCVDISVTDRLQREIGELNTLIRLFLSEIPGKMRSIRSAISSDNCIELEHAAHTLKSNCITFGAMVMADICHKLERIGHQGTTNGTLDLLAVLETQSQDVTNFLRNYFQIDTA